MVSEVVCLNVSFVQWLLGMGEPGIAGRGGEMKQPKVLLHSSAFQHKFMFLEASRGSPVFGTRLKWDCLACLSEGRRWRVRHSWWRYGPTVGGARFVAWVLKGGLLFLKAPLLMWPLVNLCTVHDGICVSAWVFVLSTPKVVEPVRRGNHAYLLLISF